MQSVTLLSLPTESLCSILGWIPKASQKDLRFVNKQFSDILKRTLLASIVFNVHRENLDLSLFETLASNQNGPEPTGLAVLVKELTIVSLDPHDSFVKDGSDPPPEIDIEICEQRLTSLLGQALYGLRNIVCLRWEAQRNQPLSVSSILAKWISRQLVKLEGLHIPHFQQRPRVFGNLNRPSLLTLRQVAVVLKDPYCRDAQRLQNIIANACGLQQLYVTADSISSVNTLFSPRVRPGETPGPILEATPSLTKLCIDVRGDSGGALSTYTLQHISRNIRFLQVNSISEYGFGLEVNDIDSIWRELKPDHLITLTCLYTDALSQVLIHHLTYSFPNLRELGITIIWRYIPRQEDDYYYQVANGFFDAVVPALASRLEMLRISVAYHNVLPWCFGRHSSDRFNDMIKKMRRLESLTVAVLSEEPQGAEQSIVDLLISHVKGHPCLRQLVIDPRRLTLPKQWSYRGTFADDDRPLGQSDLLRIPDSIEDAWYRPELNQDTGLIIYRL